MLERDPQGRPGSTLVWYAPLLTFDFGADTSIGDLGDPNTGIAFNMYCLAEVVPGAPQDGLRAPATSSPSATPTRSPQQTGDALLMTEYGATDDLAKIERVAALADEHMVGWQQWHYCDCDDPTTTGTGVQSIVGDASKPPRGENLNRAKLKAVLAALPTGGRRHAERLALRPRHASASSSATRRRRPAGKRLPRAGSTEVFIPPIHYHGRYEVKVQGARVVSRPGARRLLLERSRGARSVSLVVTPRG